ncbi:hypothetical protein M231_04563 [Tremella mesenterica]|uniref:ELMO domain-containing protein n=1 Tax=Tremella mesenterica TaxID=5217 RepID=A0A4Q1BKD4_TREME|nr:hypothetical protein M231_04563 [Tremella mesenterica]
MALDTPRQIENEVVMKRDAVPTNLVTYKGKHLPARIDPEARVQYVLEMMATAFQTKEHHITLCLRDENDILITQNNLPSKIYNHDNLKLVSSPAIEALAVVTALQHTSLRPSFDSSINIHEAGGMSLKLALFNLQKYVKEDDFAVEFMLRGGVAMLVELVCNEALSGNSLAYALQGIRGLLEYEAPWLHLTDAFVHRVVSLLITSTAPNIIRPATAIVRKLVIGSAKNIVTNSANTGTLVGHPGYPSRKGKEKEKKSKDVKGAGQYGFDRVWPVIQKVGEGILSDHGGSGAERVFRVMVGRLESTGDLELVAQSLGLVNASLRSAAQESSSHYPALVGILERLSVRRYVSRLMPTSANNIVENQILNFQARYMAILDHRRLRPVRPVINPDQEKMLDDIWFVGQLEDEDFDGLSTGHSPVRGLGPRSPRTPRSPGLARREKNGGGDRTMDGWVRIGLGFDQGGVPVSSEADLFRDVGSLGLECLHWFAMHEESFHNVIMEQQARPEDRRCPIGAASAECVKILCEHYKISQAGHHAPAHFQLFLLNFPRLHHLVLRFFMRMWHESESRLADFARLSFLVRSQIRLSLADEAGKTWLHLEQELEADYRTIRDRQLEMLEREDGMLARQAVRELKEKLGKDAYEVMAEQRIGCMLQGSWFNAATILIPGIQVGSKPNSSKPLRFLRLSSNRRTIAYSDFPSRTPTPPTYDSLLHHIDISNITTIRTRTGTAIKSLSPNLISKLSFSLMSGELSLLDVDAVHTAQMSEWTDGLRVLRGEGGMGTKESGAALQMLNDLALKIRLLDITGDGLEIPEKVSIGQAPRSVDFWFAR